MEVNLTQRKVKIISEIQFTAYGLNGGGKKNDFCKVRWVGLNLLRCNYTIHRSFLKQ